MWARPLHAYPNPLQRRITVDFLRKNKVPTVERLDLVSDSSFVRGAIIALNWIIPKAKVRSFPSRDVVGCLKWLSEISQFDVQAPPRRGLRGARRSASNSKIAPPCTAPLATSLQCVLAVRNARRAHEHADSRRERDRSARSRARS